VKGLEFESQHREKKKKKKYLLPMDPNTPPFLDASDLYLDHIASLSKDNRKTEKIKQSFCCLVPSKILPYFPVHCGAFGITFPSFSCFFFFFFLGSGVCTQGFVLIKQMLYCLSHTSRPFCFGYFGDGVS
jgi:hypothetical protein